MHANLMRPPRLQVALNQSRRTVEVLQRFVVGCRHLAARFQDSHLLAVEAASAYIGFNPAVERIWQTVNHRVISTLDTVLKNCAQSP